MGSRRIHPPGRHARGAARFAAIGGLLLAAALPLTAAGPAHADAPAAGAQPVTFGVQPSGPKQPDRRPFFTYSVTPGASISDHLAVVNIGLRPVTLQVYARDAFNTADGGFDVLAGGQHPVDLGSWVRLAAAQVTVPARSRAIIPFQLHIPKNATPGDHAAGIVASLTATRTDGKGNPVRLDQRVGSRIYLRVTGPLHPRLTVLGMTSAYRGSANPAGCGTVDVRYKVRNDGNVRLSGHQRVRVSGPLGTGAKTQDLPDLPDLLPGNAVSVAATVSCVLPSFRVSATATINPVPLPGDLAPAAPSAIAHSGLWALPWLVVGVLVLLVGGFGWRHLRRRRQPRPGGGKPAEPAKPAKPATAGAPADAAPEQVEQVEPAGTAG
jgi:hypothetical protein